MRYSASLERGTDGLSRHAVNLGDDGTPLLASGNGENLIHADTALIIDRILELLAGASWLKGAWLSRTGVTGSFRCRDGRRSLVQVSAPSKVIQAHRVPACRLVAPRKPSAPEAHGAMARLAGAVVTGHLGRRAQLLDAESHGSPATRTIADELGSVVGLPARAAGSGCHRGARRCPPTVSASACRSAQDSTMYPVARSCTSST